MFSFMLKEESVQTVHSQRMNISSGKGSVTIGTVDNSESLFRADPSTIYSGLSYPFIRQQNITASQNFFNSQKPDFQEF